MPKSAIVTLTVGENCLNYWKRYCQANWSAYASRHGFDLIQLAQPLDTSARAGLRSPSWQKCLILSQDFSRNYQRIVWIDADVVINPRAPSILDGVPDDKVGAVISGAYILDDLKPLLLERLRGKSYPTGPARPLWEADQRTYYALFGLDDGLSDIVQGGVLVLTPDVHAPLLEKVYHADYPDHGTYEQIPLSHTLQRANQFHALDSRFNTVFYERMLVHYPYLAQGSGEAYDLLARHAVWTEFANSFLLHFAYDPGFVRYLV
jgi:hypothetical protein